LFVANDDVEAPADQAPIQLETLSPVASHALFGSFSGSSGRSKELDGVSNRVDELRVTATYRLVKKTRKNCIAGGLWDNARAKNIARKRIIPPVNPESFVASVVLVLVVVVSDNEN
jgi:hypothetical protein